MPLKRLTWERIRKKAGRSLDTEQKDALEKLRASEERYRAIITVSNTGAWEYNLETDVVWYSAQYFAMLGFDRPDGTWDNSIANTWVDMLHPDDRERSVQIFDDFLKGGSEGVYEHVFRMQHANGDWVWISSRARRLRDENGNLTNITLGTHIDISEQIDYIVSIEQAIFDIGHVMRRPISTMMGMTKLIVDSDLSEQEIKDYSQKLYQVSDEMDKFIHELNLLYHQKRQNTKLNIDVSAIIDQRGSLFN